MGRETRYREKTPNVEFRSEFFAEDDPILIANVVKAIILTDTNPFPPSIADIKHKAYDLSHSQLLSDMEAWNIVMSTLRNCGRNAQSEFDKLPKEIQAITTPQQLQQWSQMDSGQLNTVVSSNFMRSYRNKEKNVQQNRLLPNCLKTFIDEYREKSRIEDKAKVE